MHLPKIYPITDRRVSGLSHSEQVNRLSAGGATFLQLREKDLSPHDFFEEGKQAVARCKELNVTVIINDRVDIALALKVDGVHLGQDDLPPEAARLILGDSAIIGYSTHNAEQVKRAVREPVSYIAVGPVFATTSKSNPDAVIGLDGLRRARDLVKDLPLVAIGGITLENAPEVIKAGADSVALIAALLGPPIGITARTTEFLRAVSGSGPN
jgi:thiamine-phosphate pyrophosphorylase